VVNAEQRRELHLRVDLLAAFAHRGVGGVLVVVDKPARKAPQPITRLDGAPSEHHAAVQLYDYRSHDLGVAPQDEVVVGTCLDFLTVDRSDDQRRAAVDAVVAHRDRA
jgi:hypothetical protein